MSDWLGLVGRVVAEKFRVDRLVGEGGHGVVYAGMHLFLNVPVAIKFMKPTPGAGAAQETEAFVREARMLFTLTHPAIVRMYEVGTLSVGSRLPVGSGLPSGPNQVPFVVLELLDGVGLDRAILDRRAQGRHFAPQEILLLMGPLFDGLAFAHARGVTHRDLKPSNLMLTRGSTGAMEPRILDFGMARNTAQLMQSANVTGFTPLYSAPEQWDPRFGPTSPRTDVFAMGLTLAEVCTLAQVFANMPSMAQLMHAITNPAHRPRVSAARADLPPGIDEIILRATAVGPQDRYPDAAAMHDALRRVFQVEVPTGPLPVRASSLAPPPTVPAPLQAPAVAITGEVTTGAPFAVPTSVSPFAPVPVAPPPPEGSSGTVAFVLASLALVVVLGVFLYAGVIAKPASKYVDEDPDPKTAPSAAPTATPRPPEPPVLATAAPPSGPPPTVSAAEVTGAIAWGPNEIAAAVRTHQKDIDSCAQAGPSFTGRAAMTVTVETKGSVAETTCAVANGDIAAFNFCACAEERVHNWKLPAVKKPSGPGKTGAFNLAYVIKPATAAPPRAPGKR